MKDLEKIELKKQIEESSPPANLLDSRGLRSSIDAMAIVDSQMPLDFVVRYHKALKFEEDTYEIAKLVAIMIMPSVNRYVNKELALLGLELEQEEAQQCQERCFERIVGYVSDHLKTAKMLSYSPRDYAMALGMFLVNRSYRSINAYFGWSAFATNGLSDQNKWAVIKRDIANFITIVAGETYDAANQLGNIKVIHYAAPVLDALGREVMKRITTGGLGELSTKDLMKQFNDSCRLVADMKGDLTSKVEISHNLGGIFAAMKEMKDKGIAPTAPERKLIE